MFTKCATYAQKWGKFAVKTAFVTARHRVFSGQKPIVLKFGLVKIADCAVQNAAFCSYFFETRFFEPVCFFLFQQFTYAHTPTEYIGRKQ